jgi:hypothetical protein
MKEGTNSANTQVKLGLYTIAAGAFAAGNAFAVPTPSPNAPSNVFAADNSSASVNFDIDGNGTDDFQIYVQASDSCNFDSPGYAYFSPNDARFVVLEEDNYYAAMISPGQRIDGSANFDNSTAFLIGCNYEDSQNAAFTVGESGFVGLEFQRNGNTHFGYLEVQLDAGSLNLNILSACFESEPGTPLAAGRCTISPIPVNGVVVPLSLALLALGGMALRRRKQQA